MEFLADTRGKVCQLQRPTDRYYEEGKYFCFGASFNHKL